MLSPIVLFTYNRLEHTKLTIEALKKNELVEMSDLIIYSDAPKYQVDQIKVKQVREYLKTVSGFKSIKLIFQKKNLGLAQNIIQGVTKVVNNFGKIIVLEDDIVTSTGFLKFMNESLDKYENNKKV